MIVLKLLFQGLDSNSGILVLKSPAMDDAILL